MINYVIFGSNSFIGSNFIDRCISNEDLILISKKVNSIQRNKVKKYINFNLSQFYEIELIKNLSLEIINNIKFNKTIFILFSWHNKKNTKSIGSYDSLCIENKNIILNFARICTLVNPDQVIFTSSAGGIYDQNTKLPAKELDKPVPYSRYGYEKLIAENYLKKELNHNLLILRISSVYGYVSNEFWQGVLCKWIILLKSGNELELYNSHNSFVNFISIKQVLQAISVSVNKKLFGTYNIGSKESTKLNDLIKAIKKLSEKEINIKTKDDSFRSFLLNTDKFFKSTNIYFPTRCLTDLEKIKRLIDENEF